MRTLMLIALLAIFQLPLFAQDFLSTQGSTLPGTVVLNDGNRVTGKVSYSFAAVFVQSEGSPTATYKASEVSGFVLENGGGEFISVASGKKGRFAFYEVASSKSARMMLLLNANSIDKRGKEKDENGIKIQTRYYLYATDEKQLIEADLKEIAEFMKTRCEGISTAISEYKDKTYHYGPMAGKDEIRNKLLRIADDYSNNRCKYIPRDY